jgi:tryptophan synthase alpha chain
MNLLESRFASLSEKREKALVLFLTAGDQPLHQLPDLLKCLEDGGADAIEVGIPFSDPFGEGPTIQASSQRSLDNGTSVKKVLVAMAKSNLSIPLVTMGYTNPVMRFGLQAFASASREAGSCGTILSDLTPDESDDWCRASEDADLKTIFLVAPTSPGQRIEEVAKRSTGFVYVVSRTGVTGAENAVPDDVSSLVRRVKTLTEKHVSDSESLPPSTYGWFAKSRMERLSAVRSYRNFIRFGTTERERRKSPSSSKSSKPRPSRKTPKSE